ncbi:hypothetical protein [uncultured Chitinophaga sp.]|jgi:hypothetical protein|uniref:hypothetical protein n=1 Tax=uncultured Chitinophaga sp. TaxID=339340 RepID=UPI0026110ACC|nr:hypothetical protein [uncultured Chitinophaga sp.]
MEAVNKKKRVFWHEFGHFSAAYYSKKHYGKFGTASINIIRCDDYFGEIEFHGNHTPIAPNNYKDTDPIKHPASLIAELVYGCYLQCLFLNKALDSCLNERGRNVFGYDDYEKCWGVARKFGLTQNERQVLHTLIDEHFRSIKENGDFATLFDIDINDLIEEDLETTPIDPQELEDRFQSILVNHESKYRSFVQRSEKLFEGKQQVINPFQRGV